ncbi:MAG: NAD(P)H-dependent oxidoreductase [Bacteroidota bacterium]|nr:NAD(P)H-dependent oxidoreductase [Bacteroidota bacterium]
MITIISGTNRKFSKTLIVAKAYQEILTSLGTGSQIFSMEELPATIAQTHLSDSKDVEFADLIKKYIDAADKIIVVVPEYQATFPGIFKLMLDGVPHKAFEGKRVAMVGVSSGRGGNIRGLDHLTSAFHYLEAYVYPNKLPISNIRDLVNAEFQLTDEGTLAAMKRQAVGFLKY